MGDLWLAYAAADMDEETLLDMPWPNQSLVCPYGCFDGCFSTLREQRDHVCGQPPVQNGGLVNRTCFQCAQVFEDSALLEIHNNLVHPAPDVHRNDSDDVHGPPPSLAPLDRTCLLCKTEYQTPDDLELHRSLAHPARLYSELCEQCGEFVKLSEHSHNAEVQLCDVCGHMASLADHKHDHSSTPLPSQESKGGLCEFCGDYAADLAFHLKNHTSQPSTSRATHVAAAKSTESFRQFKCTVCNASFARADNLARHAKKHENPDFAQCPFCYKPFPSVTDLERHIDNLHDDNQEGRGVKRKRDACQICGKDNTAGHQCNTSWYTIKKGWREEHKKFFAHTTTYSIFIKDPELVISGLEDILRHLTTIFDDIIANIFANENSEARTQIVLSHPTLDFPIVFAVRKIKDLSADYILSEIARILQSHEEFVLDKRLEFLVTVLNSPKGGASLKHGKNGVNFANFLSQKRSVVRIHNIDTTCCARAIFVAQQRLSGRKNVANLAKSGSKECRTAALGLIQRAGVGEGPCGVDELKEFQKVIEEQIIVYFSDGSVMFQGEGDYEEKVTLLFSNNHYDVITSVPGFFRKKNVCQRCNKTYAHYHTCKDTCRHCNSTDGPCVPGDRTTCVSCNLTFSSHECYLNHKSGDTPRCDRVKKCKSCGKMLFKGRTRFDNHSCEEKRCNVCKEYVERNHRCHMQVVKQEPESKWRFICYDFETAANNPEGKHEAVACSVAVKCWRCPRDGFCLKKCGYKWFSGKDTVHSFCSWLFSKANKNSIAFAHNNKGFDGMFLIKWLETQQMCPYFIFNGQKVILINAECLNLRILDSLSFFSVALTKLPAMFGFKEKLLKGWFPHYFTSLKNMKYVGDWPERSFFGYNQMDDSEKKTFDEWYEAERKKGKFHFMARMKMYADNDVAILLESVLRFKELFEQVTSGIFPYKATTIASACQLVYRTNFLSPRTIGIIPAEGYLPKDLQSGKALQWLTWLEHSRNIKIQHARTEEREKVIDGVKVDGWLESKRQVFMFNGCFWHS